MPDLLDKKPNLDELNPAEKLQAGELAALDQIEAGLRDDGFKGLDESSNESSSASESLRDNEYEAGALSSHDASEVGLKNKQARNQNRFKGALRFMGKRKGVIGTIVALTVGGGVLGGVFGPASMLINLTENLTLGNDSSSVAMERRFLKVFANATAGDGLCQGKIKCRMGKISNNALRAMASKGIVPIVDGKTYNPGRTGYPEKNPTEYEITDTDGNKRKVPAAQMTDELLSDRRLASKVLGTGGAFNLRVRAWTGKHIDNKLFRKAGIPKNGGLAADSERGKNSAERENSLRKRTATRAASSQAVSSEALRAKVEKQLGPAKKGGAGYTAAVAGCVAVKGPRYVAAAIAGAQLLQILPLISDIVLSPGSKMKAAGLGASFTPQDASAVGDLLTSRHPDGAGNMKSALDAPELLAALGVNKGKLAISEDFTPGYAVSKMSVVQGGVQAEKATEDACNTIMSPAAMYSAMSADAVVTAASSVTIVGGIAKVIAGWVISESAIKVASLLLENVAMDVITDLAQNDKIPTAKGIALGSVLGISAMAFFSSGGMARHLPALKMSQLAQFDEIRLANEQLHREMDIATLSPFDTSSRHTFLGSIVHNLGSTMIANGTLGQNVFSTISTIARLPLTALSFSTSASAATNISATYCGYAEEFGLTTPNPADVPAINASGLPCTGLTTTQDSMTTKQAISYLENEGWLDTTIDTEANATIDDLLAANVIRQDTPMADFITACGDASSGDYMYNSAGCTVGDGGDVSSIKNVSTECIAQEDGSSLCATDSEEFANSTELAPLKNAKALSAISVFLLDYQILQSMNGEDESESATGDSVDRSTTPESVSNAPSDGSIAWPLDQKLYSSKKNIFLKDHGTSSGTFTKPGGRTGKAADLGANSLGVSRGEPIYSMLGGTVRRIGGGHAVIISSQVAGGKVEIAYAHGENVRVKAGDSVAVGQQVFGMGNEGNSQGTHLHIDMSFNDQQFCPQDLFIFMNDNPGKLPNFADLVSKANSSRGCSRL